MFDYLPYGYTRFTHQPLPPPEPSWKVGPAAEETTKYSLGIDSDQMIKITVNDQTLTLTTEQAVQLVRQLNTLISLNNR